MKHTLLVLTKMVLIGFCMFLTQKIYAQTATAPSAGDGTEANPYQIATLENLFWLSQNSAEWDKHYIQTADINAGVTTGWDNDSGFTPIGNTNTQFTGTYNGQGFSIESLFIDRPGINGVGLFGYISGSSVVISDLMLTNVEITGENWTGGVVGRNVDATIEKVGSTGQVSGYYYVGGIVGHSTSGFIKFCYSKANVSATSNEAGGIAGKFKEGNIQNSYAHGAVTADESVGGFVGYLYQGSINNCYSTGAVTGNSLYSGFIGNNPNGTSNNCFYDKETSGQSTGKGATGLTSSQMKDVYNYYVKAWDFINEDDNGSDDYWGINETDNNAYPFLWWQDYQSINICFKPLQSTTNVIINKSYDKLVIESYQNSDAEGFIIFINDTADFDDMVDGQNPESNQVWQDNGQQCVYNGTSINPNLEISGLDHYNIYYIKIYSYNICDEQRKYENDSEIIVKIMVNSTKPDGEGTYSSPLLIESLDNIAWICENSSYWSDEHMRYKQVADINASETYLWLNGDGFYPIGSTEKPFKGYYYGKGHIIDSLYVNRPETNDVGFFGYTTDAWIEDVGFTNLDITGNTNVGGIIGRDFSSILKGCFTTGKITGYKNIGGIVGNIYGDRFAKDLEDVYSRCELSGDNTIGGIVGYLSNEAAVKDAYCTGAVTGNYNISGGIYGAKSSYPYTGTVNCAFDSETTGCGGSLGKTTEEMKLKQTFIDLDWDLAYGSGSSFNEWGINENMNDGYPFLDWQWKGPIPVSENLEPATGVCDVNVQFSPKATDICGDTIIGKTDSLMYKNTNNEWVIKWTYEGGGNKTSYQEQLVNLTDDEAPVPDVENLSDITDECSVSVEEIPTATDNCSGAITATTSDPLEYTEQGTYTITWTFEDENGNVATQEQDVIINDLTNPTISCIENQVIEITGNETVYTVSGDEFDPESTADNCQIESVSNDFNDLSTLDGAEFPIGTTTVNWTVVDMNGNTNECTYNVTVNNPTGLDLFEDLGISIYPNPVSDKLLVIMEKQDVNRIDIYDLTGKLIYSKDNITEKDEIDFSAVNKGVYIISLTTDNSKITRKIIKN